MPEDAAERMTIEVVEVSPHIAMPAESQTVAGEVFRQLLQQAIRVADQANSQSVRMAADFAEIYRREQAIRNEYEAKLRELRLMERQTTRYAEDLAQMLRAERERREELERALDQERVTNDELRRTGLQGISHLLLAATIKDQTTGAHLLRVRRYVEAIAGRLGLPTELHCIDGEVMLGDARFFETARAVAREHHERWDGKGYPDGKKGSDISLAARIVSVADVFDALSSKRPYKAAWSLEEGMTSIRSGAGAQFDPDVVAAFESLQKDGTVDRIRREVGASKLD